MILDRPTIAYITNVVRTASLFKIDSLIIEPDRVRAEHEAQAAVILHTSDVPVMPFGAIGLNRLDTLTSRLDIVSTAPGFEIDVLVETRDANNVFARAMTLKAKGTKIDYRCANPATIKAPKQFGDALVRYRTKMTPEAVLNMQRASSAMGGDVITLTGNDEGVSFMVKDSSSDEMNYKFADEVTNEVDGSAVNFCHKYPIKTLITLFKQVPDAHFGITSRGFINVAVNGLNMYFTPSQG